MSALRGLWEALRTATIDLARRPLFSVLSVAAMTAAVLALAGFLLTSRGAREVFGRLSGQTAAEVYLRPGAGAAAVEDLFAQLSNNPAVRRVDRISSDQALAEFARLYPDLADIKELLGDNPLPASLRVTPRSPDPRAVGALVRLARAHPAALSVRYDRQWLESLARFGEALRLVAGAGAVVLLLAALVTVGAVIRLALDDRLDEVALLRIVGAPVYFTLSPVLLGGAILGGAGGLAAILLVSFGRAALLAWAGMTSVGAQFVAALGPPPSVGLGFLLVAIGAFAGAASAGFAAGRTALK